MARGISRLIGRLTSLAAVTAVVVQLGGCVTEPVDPSSFMGYTPADEDFAGGAGNDPSPQTLFALAKILAAQERNAEGAAVLGSVIAQHPTFGPAYVLQAELLIREGRTADAVASLQHGVAQNPDDGILLNDLGMALAMNGDYAEAVVWLEAAVEVAPREAIYHGNLAMALGMAGRYDEAFAAYERISYPARAHYNLGIICEARRDYDRAAQEFATARELDRGVMKGYRPVE